MADLKIGIIGGSGLGEALGGEAGERHEIETPFGRPSGPILSATWEGTQIAILQRHGPGHLLQPSCVPYRANVYALKAIGCTHILASGATGSLREEIRPGDLVIADQIIDKTHKRAGTFYQEAAVHVEFAEPFCPIMRRWLLSAASRLACVRVHERGTYICMEGPAFSTRAESQMHRVWGGDLIGMTAMPEAKLAREAELPYALLALPTDYDCWRPHRTGVEAQALLAEILGNLRAATERSIALIRAALMDVSLLRAEPSPARDALRLAIWSDKSKIPREEVSRLSLLWGRYF